MIEWIIAYAFVRSNQLNREQHELDKIEQERLERLKREQDLQNQLDRLSIRLNEVPAVKSIIPEYRPIKKVKTRTELIEIPIQISQKIKTQKIKQLKIETKQSIHFFHYDSNHDNKKYFSESMKLCTLLCCVSFIVFYLLGKTLSTLF